MFSLGRHVNHDPRSRGFPAPRLPVRAVEHRHHGQVLDQGQVGSCTANALIHALATEPLWRLGRRSSERAALRLYGLETRMEGQPWPPNDPGGSGLMVCKAARELGLIGGYTHAFGLEHCLEALALQPVIIGIPWREAMFTPGPGGLLYCSGDVAGGHEVCLVGLDPGARTVRLLNSWGAGWGVRGTALLAWDDLGALLADEGDVTVPAAA